MKKTIQVTLPSTPPPSYQVWIDSNLLEKVSLWMPKDISTVVIISDEPVKQYYGTRLEQNLKQEGYQTLLLSFPTGESFKNSQTKSQLEEQMLNQGCDRNSLILGLGGGVVGDLAGFIAATYMRGIAYLHVPTTLLAMIDSSIGGKTGIDTPQGKNLIGAFWQPEAVIADIHCLKTLPRKHLINGLIEAIKIFLTCDAKMLFSLEERLDLILNYDEDCLMTLIRHAAHLKVNIIEQDEKEHHKRAILNFGHTIGHALEHLSDYQLLHGTAVALGLLMEAKIAELMGFLHVEHYQYIKRLLCRLDIHAESLKQYKIADIIQSTQLDKKRKKGQVHYVLLKEPGSVHVENNQFTHLVEDEVVEEAFYILINEIQSPPA